MKKKIAGVSEGTQMVSTLVGTITKHYLWSKKSIKVDSFEDMILIACFLQESKERLVSICTKWLLPKIFWNLIGEGTKNQLQFDFPVIGKWDLYSKDSIKSLFDIVKNQSSKYIEANRQKEETICTFFSFE